MNVRLSRNELLAYFLIGLKSLRPVLIPFFALILLVGAAASENFSIQILLHSIYVGVLGAWVLFPINDYFDKDTDYFNERKGGIWGIIADEGNIKIVGRTALAGYVLTLGSALVYGGLVGLMLFLLLLGSTIYSAPPFRVKSRPFLDSVSNAVTVYFALLTGTFIAGGSISSVIDGFYWVSLAAGGMHALGTLPDIESDRKAGINTIGTVLGWRKVLLGFLLIPTAALTFENWSGTARIGWALFYPMAVPLLINPTPKTWDRVAKTAMGIYLLLGIYWLVVYKWAIIAI